MRDPAQLHQVLRIRSVPAAVPLNICQQISYESVHKLGHEQPSKPVKGVNFYEWFVFVGCANEITATSPNRITGWLSGETGYCVTDSVTADGVKTGAIPIPVSFHYQRKQSK